MLMYETPKIRPVYEGIVEMILLLNKTAQRIQRNEIPDTGINNNFSQH